MSINELKYFALLMTAFATSPTLTLAVPQDSTLNGQFRATLELDFIHASRLAYLLPLTPSSQISFALDVNIDQNNGTSDGNSTVYSNPDTTLTKIPGRSNSFSGEVRIATIYLVDLLSSGSFSLFAGAGPFVTYSRSYGSDEQTSIGKMTTITLGNSNSSYSWTYGAAAEFGVQIAVVEHLGIHAQYDFFAGYQKTKSDTRRSSYDSNYGGSSVMVSTEGDNRVLGVISVIAVFSFFF